MELIRKIMFIQFVIIYIYIWVVHNLFSRFILPLYIYM